MDCEVCKEPYNLVNNMPMELPCCNETICKQCMNTLIGSNQQETFQCPITDCHESNSCHLSSFKINKAIVKHLKKQIGIYCEEHKSQQTTFYCKDHNKLICTTCAFDKHTNHQAFPVDKQQLTEYNERLIQKLKIEQERIGRLIEEIEKYQRDERQFEAADYIKMMDDAVNTLISTIDDELEREKVKFASIFNQPQQIQEQIAPVQDVYGSTLLNQERVQMLKSWIPSCNRFDLIYKGTRDHFSALAFHSNCDNKGPTLTVVQSEHDKLFGGFASISWEQAGDYKADDKGFIFSITHKTKFDQKEGKNKQYAVHLRSTYGPKFGGGCDIYISDNCNQNNNSYSNFGHTYKTPDGIQYGTEQAKNYLAGSYKFKVKEYEVFKVIY